MDPDLAYPTIEDQVQLVGELSRESIPVGTGSLLGGNLRPGDEEAARPGVNLVLSSGYSFAHAEMVALVVA